MFSVYPSNLYELSVRSRVQTGTVLWEKEPCLGGTIYVTDFVSSLWIWHMYDHLMLLLYLLAIDLNRLASFQSSFL